MEGSTKRVTRLVFCGEGLKKGSSDHHNKRNKREQGNGGAVFKAKSNYLIAHIDLDAFSICMLIDCQYTFSISYKIFSQSIVFLAVSQSVWLGAQKSLL